jgi:Domain of unknown function (DUF4249)
MLPYKLPFFALFTLICMLVTACRPDFFNKTIILDDETYDKKMVMYCFYSNEDTVLRASVSQNLALTQPAINDSFYVRNPDIKWIDPTGAATGMFDGIGNTFFHYNTLPSLTPGIKYTMQASATGLTGISAEQVMPSAIQIDTVIYTEDAGVTQFGDDLSRVEVRFQDPAGTKDYYALEVRRKLQYINFVYDSNGQIIREDTFTYTNRYYPEEPLDPGVENGQQGELVLSDAIFDGQKYNLRFNFVDYNNGISTSKFYVRLRHITEDEYRYIISEAKRQASEDFPLVEPVIVHSNIKDGIGIFGLSWSKTTEVE